MVAAKIPNQRFGRVDPKEVFDRENEARKTLAQIVGAVFLLAGLYSSLQTLRVQEQGQVTDRFTKAIDQLGAMQPGPAAGPEGKPRVNLETRIGGVYALERIAIDSPRDDWPIIEVLCAYVRDNSPNSGVGTTIPVQPDIQAVLTVIGRRNIRHDQANRRVDLSETNLSRVTLIDATLKEAVFINSNLNHADLSGPTSRMLISTGPL